LQGIQGIQGTIGSGGGPPSRAGITTSTGSLSSASSIDLDIDGYKSYLLQKIETSSASWVTIYTDSTSRTADASRSEDTDPLPGSGVVGEFISTEAKTQLFTPGTIGFNNDIPVSSTIYAKVYNKSGITTDITLSLTVLSLES